MKFSFKSFYICKSYATKQGGVFRDTVLMYYRKKRIPLKLPKAIKPRFFHVVKTVFLQNRKNDFCDTCAFYMDSS